MEEPKSEEERLEALITDVADGVFASQEERLGWVE